MSNSKNAIQEIKKLMVQFGFMTEESAPLSFKLADNTILQTEKLEAGKAIYKINEEFEKVALENGSYKIENFNVEVVDGKIETVKEIFLDAKLVDGTLVKVGGDSLVEGAKVTVVQEDAEIPAPDGVHELEDGTKVETKDGVIVKVEEAVKEAESEEEKPEIEIEVPSLALEKEVVEMLQDFIKKMGEKMALIEKSYSKLENEFNSFKKEPAAKKIADGKTEFSSIKTEDIMDEKLKTIMSLRKSNK